MDRDNEIWRTLAVTQPQLSSLWMFWKTILE